MKIEYVSDHPFTDEGCKSATGKTPDQWYELIEANVPADAGRRLTTHYLFNDHKLDIWWSTTLSVEHEKRKGLVEKDGRPKGYFICVTKTIAAPVAAHFQAWSTNEGLAKWFGAIASGTMTEGQEISSADGNRMIVKRVRADKDLRFLWVRENGDESLVDVSFADKGKGKTYLLINHDRIQTREEADGLRKAWGGVIDELKKTLEANV